MNPLTDLARENWKLENFTRVRVLYFTPDLARENWKYHGDTRYWGCSICSDLARENWKPMSNVAFIYNLGRDWSRKRELKDGLGCRGRRGGLNWSRKRELKDLFLYHKIHLLISSWSRKRELKVQAVEEGWGVYAVYLISQERIERHEGEQEWEKAVPWLISQERIESRIMNWPFVPGCLTSDLARENWKSIFGARSLWQACGFWSRKRELKASPSTSFTRSGLGAWSRKRELKALAREMWLGKLFDDWSRKRELKVPSPASQGYCETDYLISQERIESKITIRIRATADLQFLISQERIESSQIRIASLSG